MHFGSTLSHLWKALASASGAGHDIRGQIGGNSWWTERGREKGQIATQHLCFTASKFNNAGDLQEKLVLCIFELLREAKRPGSGGAGGGTSTDIAPYQEAESADWERMCELPQCPLTCSEFSHALPASFQILHTEFSLDYPEIPPSGIFVSIWETKLQFN